MQKRCKYRIKLFTDEMIVYYLCYYIPFLNSLNFCIERMDEPGGITDNWQPAGHADLSRYIKTT